MSTMLMLSFIGRSNSGKTTLLEKLIPALIRRGYRIAVVKHTLRRDVETDIPGKDTRRLWDAGAAHTTFITPDRIVHTHRCAAEPSLDEALRDIRDVDVILLEGYKGGNLPKIEVIRAARDTALIPGLEGRVACVTDVPDLCYDVPRFGFDDIVPLADFIESLIAEQHGTLAGN